MGFQFWWVQGILQTINTCYPPVNSPNWNWHKILDTEKFMILCTGQSKTSFGVKFPGYFTKPYPRTCKPKRGKGEKKSIHMGISSSSFSSIQTSDYHFSITTPLGSIQNHHFHIKQLYTEFNWFCFCFGNTGKMRFTLVIVTVTQI